MKLKTISLMLTGVILLCSCSVSKDSTNPDGTYRDTNPTMIMAKTDDVKVPYQGYRLYLDVIEQLARQTAIENIAYTRMIVKDIETEGLTVDKESFEAEITPYLQSVVESPDMANVISIVMKTTGMNQQRFIEAAKLDYWPQTVSDQLMTHLASKATDEKTIIDLYDEYSKRYDERIDFTDSSVLVTLDGEKIAYTQIDKDYVEYSAMMARVTTIENIATKHIIYEDLKNRNITIDIAGFEEYKNQTIQVTEQDEIYNKMLPIILEKFNITKENYNKELEAYIMLGYISMDFWDTMKADYEALPEDGRPESIEMYGQEYMMALTDNLEFVNVKGK